MVYEWKDGLGDRCYYYEVPTGKIVGRCSKIALDNTWNAIVHTGIFSNTIDDEKILGQYIDLHFCKQAVVRFWDIESRTLIE